MSTKQRVIVLIGTLLILAALLFPPWYVSTGLQKIGAPLPVTHAFLLHPLGDLAAAILLLEIASIVLIFGVSIWLLKSRKSS